ncbi:hypothetical protein [Altericista sp. CCNU0014]|uniref:hypothetical protein n=1 Tax=Altericista sp. CCNU0014 TaxID=3082949 RepID=UPI00384CDC0A
MISDIYYEATGVTAISDILILNKLYMLRISNSFCQTPHFLKTLFLEGFPI